MHLTPEDQFCLEVGGISVQSSPFSFHLLTFVLLTETSTLIVQLCLCLAEWRCTPWEPDGGLHSKTTSGGVKSLCLPQG